jgi:hypothetical protein
MIARHRKRLWVMHGFFAIFALISLRYLLIRGDHIWTGETDRFSWNMRLRSRICVRQVSANSEGPWSDLALHELNDRQRMQIDDPFVLHSYVRKALCPKMGKVFARVNCRANSRLPALLLDPAADLCQVDFKTFAHNAWVNPDPGAWDPEFSTRFRTSKDILNTDDLRDSEDEEEPSERPDSNDS